jgi:hypothetical protein
MNLIELLFFTTALAVTNLAVKAAKPRCGPNEVYRTCSSCDQTCRDIRSGNPILCHTGCRPPRCQCKPGFVRSDAGRCVRPKQCKTKRGCGKNAELKGCGACDTSCAQALKNDPARCILSCRPPACGCKANFYRNKRNHCVSLKQCLREASPLKKPCGPFGGLPLAGVICGSGFARCPGNYYCRQSPFTKRGVCCRLRIIKSPKVNRKKRDHPCRPNRCPKGQRCTPSRRPCRINEPCPPYTCSSSSPSNPCHPNPCPHGHFCSISRRLCLREKCRPYICHNPCDGVKCPSCHACVPQRIFCVKAPCPQYQCLPTPGANPCGSNPCPAGQTCSATSCISYTCN